MNKDLLMFIVEVLGANMATMHLLGQCGQVCREWRNMVVSVRADTGEKAFTAMYSLSAVAYGDGLGVQMQDMYATALSADIVRRNQMTAFGYSDADHDLENDIHMQLSYACEQTASYLASGLQAQLMHAPTIILCLQELSTLTEAFVAEIFVPFPLLHCCQWPVLKILQAHPNDITLGLRALAILKKFSEVETPQAFDFPSIPTAAARLTAHLIVSGFLARFRPSATVAQAVHPTLREMIHVGDAVLTWIDQGTLIPQSDHDYD